MQTHRLARRALIATAGMALAAAAHGGEATEGGAEGDARIGQFEVAAFGGYRMGGEFDVAGAGTRVDVHDGGSFAVALDLQADEISQYELLYARQSTDVAAASAFAGADLDLEYLHVGGTLMVSEGWRASTYVVGTLGVTRLSLDAPGADDDTRFSMSLGAGVRVPLGERLVARFEARGYGTLVDADTSLFCRSDAAGGVCLLQASGSVLWQLELMAGLAVRF